MPTVHIDAYNGECSTTTARLTLTRLGPVAERADYRACVYPKGDAAHCRANGALVLLHRALGAYLEGKGCDLPLSTSVRHIQPEDTMNLDNLRHKVTTEQFNTLPETELLMDDWEQDFRSHRKIIMVEGQRITFRYDKDMDGSLESASVEAPPELQTRAEELLGQHLKAIGATPK